MELKPVKYQTSSAEERAISESGEAAKEVERGVAGLAGDGDGRSGQDQYSGLMERMLENSNVAEALRRVESNKGSAGVDGMSTLDLRAWLRLNWPRVKEQLRMGTFQPSAVRRCTIPKSGGGTRELGIPTVLDRFVQQALQQVMTPIFDPTFSQHSYGFRPGKSALEAVMAAQAYVQEGRTYVVDIDLEKFFDRVNHDVLMGRLAKRIGDKRVLKLIRKFLTAHVMADGVVHQREEGTPQGGPLSPLLANVLLDEVDKALEHSGHAFCRYADDLNVYVRSQRAGERVMARVEKLFSALKLRVNQKKSAVARPWERKFLGFTLVMNRHGKVKRALSPHATSRMKDRVRELTSRSRGRSLQHVGEELRRYLRGWRQYFGHVEIRQPLHGLDNFVHRRLRGLLLKQWKHGPTVYRNLMREGVPEGLSLRVAMYAKRIGWLTHQSFIYAAMPPKLFSALQLPKLAV